MLREYFGNRTHLTLIPSVVLTKSVVVEGVVDVYWFSLCLYSLTLNLGRFEELYFNLLRFLTGFTVVDVVDISVVVVVVDVVANPSKFSKTAGVVKITSVNGAEVKITVS